MKTGMEAVKDNIPSMAWLARGLKLTRGAITQWKHVPAERVPAVSRLTGLPGRVIRPDLYEVASDADGEIP